MSVQTLYAGTIRFNILLGAAKPVSEVTQEEIKQARRNANIPSLYSLTLVQRLTDVLSNL